MLLWFGLDENQCCTHLAKFSYAKSALSMLSVAFMVRNRQLDCVQQLRRLCLVTTPLQPTKLLLPQKLFVAQHAACN